MRPETESVIIVTDANGTTKTLSSDAPSAGDRPQGIQFGTQAGSGFYTASFSLVRAIDAENEDLHLGDDVKIMGADGETAWEGYITARPRSMDSDGHSLTVNCAGWAAHLADNPFSMPFIDRDLGKWHGPGNARKIGVLGSGFGQVTDASTIPGGVLHSVITGAWSAKPMCDAWYDAGPGCGIGALTATWTRGEYATDATWRGVLTLCTDDTPVSFDTTANLLVGAGPGAASIDATTDDRRYALIQFYFDAAPSGADGFEYSVDWSLVTVTGNHGIALIGPADAQGIAASDVIRWAVANYAPLISTAGVNDTTYPIEQLVAEDWTVNDLIQKTNSFHNWLFGVWEDRTLHFGPVDLNDYDWEIRHDEVGNQIGLQGDEFTDLRNRLRVRYTDLATGRSELVTGDDFAELRDDSIDNPLNAHGRIRYGETFTIPYPVLQGTALELGRIRLLEDNQPKAPGSFTCGPWVRDRSGQLQPASRVRAGHRVRLTSSASLSDRPRLVGETSYSHDGKSVTISVDSTLRVLDAYMDRTIMALSAAGIG